MRSFHSGVMHGGTDRLRSADLRATDIRTGDTSRLHEKGQSESITIIAINTYGQTRVCGEAAIAHTDSTRLALESYSTRRERGRQYESI